MSNEPTSAAASRAFGCAACFQGNAAEVWKRRPFKPLQTLVDESHFSIALMVCPACDQRCVKVFMEWVDWVDSDDPQCWAIVPLTHAESLELLAAGEQADVERIATISAGRSYLLADFPKGKPSRITWLAGPAPLIRT